MKGKTMNQIISKQLLGDQKIAFIQAAWHDDIVGQGRHGLYIGNGKIRYRGIKD